MPGAGRKEFAEKFCEATGVKNWGAGHLLWELERLKVGCPRDLFADNLFLGIRLGQAPPGVERDVRAGHALLEDARRWYFFIFQILLFTRSMLKNSSPIQLTQSTATECKIT